MKKLKIVIEQDGVIIAEVFEIEINSSDAMRQALLFEVGEVAKLRADVIALKSKLHIAETNKDNLEHEVKTLKRDALLSNPKGFTSPKGPAEPSAVEWKQNPEGGMTALEVTQHSERMKIAIEKYRGVPHREKPATEERLDYTEHYEGPAYTPPDCPGCKADLSGHCYAHPPKAKAPTT